MELVGSGFGREPQDSERSGVGPLRSSGHSSFSVATHAFQPFVSWQALVASPLLSNSTFASSVVNYLSTLCPLLISSSSCLSGAENAQDQELHAALADGSSERRPPALHQIPSRQPVDTLFLQESRTRPPEDDRAARNRGVCRQRKGDQVGRFGLPQRWLGGKTSSLQPTVTDQAGGV